MGLAMCVYRNDTYDNTKEFLPKITVGKCVKVYDGDTIWVVSKLNGEKYRFKIRMLGYDSPELKDDNEHRRIGNDAKEALSSKILDKIVKLDVHPTKRDKYGRMLANVYCNKLHINQWMMDNGYGKAYDGGKKE